MLSWIVQSLVIATLLAGMAALICRVGRLGPAARHVLWLVVLIKLVMPPLLFWPWEPPVPFRMDQAVEAVARLADAQPQLGNGRASPQVDRQPVNHAQPAAPSSPLVLSHDELTITIEDAAPQTSDTPPGVPPSRSESALFPVDGMPSTAARAEAQTAPTSGVSPTTTALVREIPGDPPAPRQLIARVLFTAGLVWLAGAVLMVVTQLVRIRRMNRRLTQAESAPDWLIQEVAELARRLNVRPPAIRVVAHVGSPCLWGWGRAKLLWPRALLDDSAQSWRGVIVHELAHLRRRDHWVGWLELVGGCVWWWNPLFWYVRHQVRNNAELACDAWVVGTLPDGRRAYAEALLAVCQLASQTATPMSALGIGSGARRDFERRLTMILRERVPLRVPRLGLLAVALLAAVALPSWSQSADEKPDESPTFDAPIADETPVLPGADDFPPPDSASSKPSARAQAMDVFNFLPMGTDAAAPPAARPAPRGTSRRVKAPNAFEDDIDVESSESESPAVATTTDNKQRLRTLERQLQGIQAEMRRLQRSLTDAAPTFEPAWEHDPGPETKPLIGSLVPGGGNLATSEDAVAAPVDEADDEVAPRRSSRDVRGAGRSPEPPQHVVESSTYTFSRTTYKLAAPKAQALAQFLELNIDGPNLLSATASGEDTLTVIAVPETQQVIGQFVALLQADAEQADKDNPLRKFRTSRPATVPQPADPFFGPEPASPVPARSQNRPATKDGKRS
jgi:beta-lactamase regulating signal transducer with metallopeptidase domain